MWTREVRETPSTNVARQGEVEAAERESERALGVVRGCG
jgi:hypothetical protein